MPDDTTPAGGGAGSTPPSPFMAGPDPRAELADAPPFLSWRIIYLIVLGALAAEIVLALALAS